MGLSFMSGGLAATLIVRDEARCITRCLESVRPWVDRMVVLDTGSTDATPELARQCGAQVHHLPWPDDFSAARNHVLGLADADWNLVIDADEWVATGGEGLRRWCAGGPRLGLACVQSIGDAPSSGAAAPAINNWIVRVIPRGVRFAGRVHEQVVSSLPAQRIALELHHDGYMAEQTERKLDRNQPLLLRELQDDPGNAYILYQLGKDAELHKDYSAACDWYGKAQERAGPRVNWFHEMLISRLHCLGQAGRHDEALTLAEAQRHAWSESPDLFFVMGNIALAKAQTDPAHALEQWLPLAASSWAQSVKIGDRPDLEGSIRGHGSHLAQENLETLRSQLAAILG